MSAKLNLSTVAFEALTNIHRLDLDTFLNMCGVRVVRDLVREYFGLAQGVHKRGASRSRRTYKRPRRDSESLFGATGEPTRLTDDHDCELHTLFGIFAASATCSHFDVCLEVQS